MIYHTNIMAECRNRKQRKTKKHPTGVVTAKECAAGKRLQALPAVKAWSQAVEEQIGFKKGSFNKIPKRGTAAHNKLVERQQAILRRAAAATKIQARVRGIRNRKKVAKMKSATPPRRSGRARKATSFFGF
jgi:hypothetical protein